MEKQQNYRGPVHLQACHDRNKILTNASNSKELFTIIQQFTKPPREATDITPSKDLCNKRSSYFHLKIKALYDNFN